MVSASFILKKEIAKVLFLYVKYSTKMKNGRKSNATYSYQYLESETSIEIKCIVAFTSMLYMHIYKVSTIQQSKIKKKYNNSYILYIHNTRIRKTN